MKSFLKPSVATLLAMSLVITLTAQAAKKATSAAAVETKGKAEAAANTEAPAMPKPKGLPYSGTLTAKTADSVTLKKKDADKTFAVTSATKITKAGKPATLEDGTIGEEAAVFYFDNNGKAEAKSVRFGAKPEKAGGDKKADKKAAKKAGKAE